MYTDTEMERKEQNGIYLNSFSREYWRLTISRSDSSRFVYFSPGRTNLQKFPRNKGRDESNV